MSHLHCHTRCIVVPWVLSKILLANGGAYFWGNLFRGNCLLKLEAPLGACPRVYKHWREEKLWVHADTGTSLAAVPPQEQPLPWGLCLCAGHVGSGSSAPQLVVWAPCWAALKSSKLLFKTEVTPSRNLHHSIKSLSFPCSPGLAQDSGQLWAGQPHLVQGCRLEQSWVGFWLNNQTYCMAVLSGAWQEAEQVSSLGWWQVDSGEFTTQKWSQGNVVWDNPRHSSAFSNYLYVCVIEEMVEKY